MSIEYCKTGEDVKGFADADWANDSSDRKSYTGYAFYLGGKAPESVESFKCRGDNYESMRCRMFYPPNNLPTVYKISYETLQNNIVDCTLDNGSDHDITLMATNSGKCIYYPSQEFHNFTLIATNALGEYTNKISINTHKSVVPPKLQIYVENITSNSVYLSWKNRKQDYYKAIGLEYNITVEPDDHENTI
ncbi:uncharacterized protein LOC120779882 [Bactrocera tryoni]|uniref:uncharacterized protein LOC120779882 n=1 Tax=Bactrocera tryoni TaxID=59916 RepID=UPI001A95993D|nr:uncharacterized protein LOC120779882 [Bactrocera tryoni]